MFIQLNRNKKSINRYHICHELKSFAVICKYLKENAKYTIVGNSSCGKKFFISVFIDTIFICRLNYSCFLWYWFYICFLVYITRTRLDVDWLELGVILSLWTGFFRPNNMKQKNCVHEFIIFLFIGILDLKFVSQI